MDKTIPILYKKYGNYINSSRAIPFIKDGCKPVERRVLLSAYEIARSKTIKSARLDGYVIGHYHPHGSVYGTIVNLVHQGFLDGQGNFGTKIGVEPCGAAASRYTEVKLAPWVKKLAFEYIDYVEKEESDLDPEPKYIPTLLPFCLIGNEMTIGLGFGYRTVIPVYDKKDLLERLLFLLGKREEIIIKPKDHGCEIIENESDIKQLLTLGKGKITYKGRYQIIPRRHIVELYSWPPHLTFQNILNKLQLGDDIVYRDISSSGKTIILFELNKRRNRDRIFNDFVNRLDKAVKDSFNYEINLVDENNQIVCMGVDELLLSIYKAYNNIIVKMANTMIQKYQDDCNHLNLLIQIRPILRNYMKKNSLENLEEVVEYVAAKTNIAQGVILSVLERYKISKLFKLNDLSKLKEKIELYKNIVKNPQDFILKEIQDLTDL